jgi:hypothetical protein
VAKVSNSFQPALRHYFLRGLCFESSSDAKCFYLWVFFLPLFVPHDSIGFTHGKRLRRNANGWGWYADDLNLISDLSNTIRRDAMNWDKSSNRVLGRTGIVSGTQIGVWVAAAKLAS